MPIRRSTLHGACSTQYLSDLGHAHGAQIYKTKREFCLALRQAMTGTTTTFCILNYAQVNEKKWLQELGFQCTTVSKAMAQSIYFMTANTGEVNRSIAAYLATSRTRARFGKTKPTQPKVYLKDLKRANYAPYYITLDHRFSGTRDLLGRMFNVYLPWVPPYICTYRDFLQQVNQARGY